MFQKKHMKLNGFFLLYKNKIYKLYCEIPIMFVSVTYGKIKHEAAGCTNVPSLYLRDKNIFPYIYKVYIYICVCTIMNYAFPFLLY